MNFIRPLTSLLALLLSLYSPLAGAVPLSEAKVTALMKAKVPDAVIAKEIQGSGLAFKVSSETLARFKAAGAGPNTLNALVGAFSKLQVAKVEIPKLLSEVFTALDEGEPTRVEKYFDKFDDPAAVYNMIMKPYSYVGHYIERISELPPAPKQRSGGFFDPAPSKPDPSFFAVVRTLDKAHNETELHIYFTVNVSRAGATGLIISKVAIPTVRESVVWGEAERNAAVNTARNFVYAIVAGNKSKVDSALWPGANSDEIPGALECYAVIQQCKGEWVSRVDSIYDSNGIRRQNGLKYVVIMKPNQFCPGTDPYRPEMQIALEKIDGKVHIVTIDWSWSYQLGNRCETFRQQSDPNEISRLEERYSQNAGKLVTEVKEKP